MVVSRELPRPALSNSRKSINFTAGPRATPHGRIAAALSRHQECSIVRLIYLTISLTKSSQRDKIHSLHKNKSPFTCCFSSHALGYVCRFGSKFLFEWGRDG